MDGRASELIEGGCRSGKALALVGVESLRQGNAEFDGDRSRMQSLDDFADPQCELAGCEFRKGHRGDGPGRDAGGEHECDATGHDGGFARAGTGLHQKGSIVDSEGGEPRGIIAEG